MMSNRVVMWVLALVGALAIIFGVVQSQNLTQLQTKLSDVQTAAVTTLSAAGAQAADAQNKTLTALAETGAIQQAQVLITEAAKASATLGVVVASSATNQASTLQAVRDLGVTQQAQIIITEAAKASATLGAAEISAATAQASALQALWNSNATNVVSTFEAQSTVIHDATQQAVALASLAAEATAGQQTILATQTAIQEQVSAMTALKKQISALQTQAAPTTVPTLVPTTVPTAVPTEAATSASVSSQTGEAQTPQQLCTAAGTAKEPETRSFSKAEQVLQANTDYSAILCTGAGAVYIDLLEKEAPLTVNNFVFLAQQGYYNNTTFHRVLENFMAQGGDPTGTGTGGPGYSFKDEILQTLTFDAPGKLAMANAGPNTNGSQFFITFGPQTSLNGGYTIFGQVVEGQANVRKIELRDPDTNPTKPGTTLDTVLIITDASKVVLKDTPPPTQADVVKAFDSVDALITSDVAAILENQKINQTTAEVVSSAPEAAQKDLETLLKAHHHQYRVGSTLNNKACDVSQIQFYATGYSLDAFATAQDAAAALDDAAMAKIAMESSFTDKMTSANLSFPYFTAKETVCDKPVVRAMTYWRRGNFVVTAQVIWPADAQQTIDVLDRVLSEFVGARLYEPLLTSILYSSID